LSAISNSLTGKIAIVAGASRGCGRGIALGLGEAGATVYVSGRTSRNGPAPVDAAPGTIEDTAEEVTRRGGRGVPVSVDHTDPEGVQSLFDIVRQECGVPDIVACAVWGGNERYLDPEWKRPFWEQPGRNWEDFLNAGPYAFWLTARAACREMASKGSGLIVAVTEPILEDAFTGQVPATSETFSHLAHYSLNRLVTDLGAQARRAGIAIVGLLPGFMKTERVEMHLKTLGDAARKESRYDLAESPEYSGRAVVALASDANVLQKAAKLAYVADLAEEYGFTDIDGAKVANFYRVLGLVK
jgi:NAD(P)-dependent dehydrogenase (short-subunit alcohol dehydrogenase family)